jgi:hypothetical protein
VLLLVGAWHEDEVGEDPTSGPAARCPSSSGSAPRSDEEAARLIACADVGIVPFRVEPFNDAGLPYRILKYARLGRPTVSPPLAGVRTWADGGGRRRRAARPSRPRCGAGRHPHPAARRGAPLGARADRAGAERAAAAALQEVGVDAGS